ncbi:MAG: MBL fold metallo-hydrolase, partial [Thermoplasmata archaeon]|nr:MBL fold metallo-hydrolase [Thermoplasmata archaeon]
IHSPIEQVYHRITHGKQYEILEYIARISSEINRPKPTLRSFARHPVRTLSRTISRFWHTGNLAKITTIAAPLLFLCCCCIFLPFLNRAPSSTPPVQPALSTQTETHTLLPSATATRVLSPTFTLTSFFTPFSTASLPPTFTATFTSSPTFTPTSTGTLAPSATLRIHFIDVGQGDATLIQTSHGQTVLIDGGDTDTGIVQYLQSIGVQRIDLMIATHVHADHIGGLVQVLQAMPVTKVVMNGELYTTSVYEHFLDAIMAAKADFVIIKRGDVVSLDGIDFLCLSPVATTNPDPNENSLVLQFAYGQTTFLMMGDSGADTEANLLASILLSKVNILKVGHHGSTTGSTSAFLNAIRPEIAIYFAGINNTYGLPDQQTIADLIAAGAAVYGTDQNGTIILTFNPNGYTITTAKSATPVLPPTSAPTLASTPTQTPTLAFTPTRIPTVPVSGGLVIVSVTSPVSPGANATLTAKASPNASCSITVYTKSGVSTAQGLDPKNADANGNVSWTWKVGTRTTPGTYNINVSCNNVTQTTTYTVK